MTTTRVYSYSRWSTKEQRAGDSARRQLAAATAYAALHGLPVDEELRDDGRSAFSGSNVKRGVNAGALGRFLERIETGEVAAGSVLVLEELDRMSRQSPMRAFNVLSSIVDAGVAVHTTNDGQTYTRAQMNGPGGLSQMLIALLAFNTANQESKKKSGRLQDSWAAKRAKAAQDGKPMNSLGPFWLELDREAQQWKPIPDRVAIVQRIFRDALAGLGANTIVRALNTEGVPPFTKAIRPEGMRWYQTYVIRLLDNPAVIGIHTPKVTVYDEDTGKATRVSQTPIPNYFPAVVDVDTYEQVKAMRLGSPHPLRGKAASKAVRNLFGGLLRCGRCGSGVYRDSKSTAKGTGRALLVCSRAKTGTGCKYETTHYDPIEEAFLAQAGELVERAPIGNGSDEVRDALDRVETAIGALDDMALSLRADTKARGFSPSAQLQLREITRERDKLVEERDEWIKKAVSASGAFKTARLSELSMALTADTLDRARANVLLRTLATSIVLDLDLGTLAVQWAAGGESVVPVMAHGYGFRSEPGYVYKADPMAPKKAKRATKAPARTSRTVKAKAPAARQ